MLEVVDVQRDHRDGLRERHDHLAALVGDLEVGAFDRSSDGNEDRRLVAVDADVGTVAAPRFARQFPVGLTLLVDRLALVRCRRLFFGGRFLGLGLFLFSRLFLLLGFGRPGVSQFWPASSATRPTSSIAWCGDNDVSPRLT